MITRAAFLAAIRARPDDDLPRLVFADWLDEQGESERAEGIRTRVYGTNHDWTDGDRRVCETIYGTNYYTGVVDGHEVRTMPGTLNVRILFHRGFAVEYAGSFANWLTHAARILPESVGLTVRLTDRPVVEYGDGLYHPKARLRGEGGWAGNWKPFHITRPYGTEREILTEMLLKELWPDVANWELPPEPTGGYLVPPELVEAIRSTNVIVGEPITLQVPIT